MSDDKTTTTRKKLVGTHTGTVVSDKCDRTRKVHVTFQVRDAKYGKYIRRRSVFHVHDPDNVSHEGDVVEIAPCRPISKTKSWRLVKVIEKAPEQV
jgi:small subunit ribosomal protein S17